ncbi:Bcr/CflA family efflux MFS transporter [Microbacterium sp. NPDC077184]|uniref:Bcr/CflA family efflux MFS transporter n=1 Tax=Microbacterium sp. NPDC077184 TaxID=3154764 RepID=UPI00343CE18D
MDTASARAQDPLGGGRIYVLGFVSMTASLSTDMYLPAFPAMSADLGASASAVQLTLTAFLIGAALGQLTIGAVSDALGRRRILIVALALFSACAFAAALSPTLEALVAIRGVQGLAGAGGAVLARAVIADLVAHDRAVRAFSTLFVMIALGPVLASPLGALLTQWQGWRAALGGLAVVSVAMLALAVVAVPESLPPDRRHSLRVRVLAGNLLSLLRVPAYVGYLLAFSVGYAAFMTYISSSSFIVQDALDRSAVEYAAAFSAASLSVMAGAWLNGRLASRWGGAGTLTVAQAIVLCASLTLALLALTDTLTFGWWIIVACVLCAGCGGVMAGASALAVRQAGRAAGAGSALLGFTQFTFGALVSPLGGAWGTSSAAPAALVMTCAAGLALGTGLFARTRGT